MRFHIGLTIGDIVEHQGDLLGDGVNVAARLASLAEDGGICASRAVYEQVRNKVDMSVVDLGLQTLKNMPEPVHALRLRAGNDGKIPDFARSDAAKPADTRWSRIAWIGLSILGLIVGWQALFSARAPIEQARPVATQNEQEAAKPAGSAVRVPSAASSSGEFDRNRKAQRCSEILERIQAGAGSAGDQAALQSDCR